MGYYYNHHRIIKDSVMVNRFHKDFNSINFEPLDITSTYRVVGKDYILKGHDGFECLKNCKQIVDPEATPSLPLMVRNHFTTLATINDEKPLTNEKLKIQKKLALRNKNNADYLQCQLGCMW